MNIFSEMILRFLLSLFDPGSADLQFWNLCNRIGHGVGQHVRRTIRKVERHKQHAFRHNVGNPCLCNNTATARSNPNIIPLCNAHLGCIGACGIPDGKHIKAIQTGGPSGGSLTAENLDEPIDFDNLVAKGSMMGSGGAIVMDEDNCIVDVAKFYMEFICDESCGKCTPCRIGTRRMLEILTKITEGKGTLEDLDKLEEISNLIKTGSLCALGQTASNPVVSTMTHFRDEYIAHVVDKKCPAKVCKNLMSYVITKDKCIGCGMCARACPADAIAKTDYIAPGKKKPALAIDPMKCVKCGACLATCKFGAISKE